VLSTGPNGEKPSPASGLKLSAAELQQINNKKPTAAIVLHYGGNDWSTAQADGPRNQLQKMGIRVIAVTDANFKPEEQGSDIETVLAKRGHARARFVPTTRVPPRSQSGSASRVGDTGGHRSAGSVTR
jgi:ribose transport system substrate-binding protein